MSVYENLVFELTSPKLMDLPLHWQVIYFEGVRSNHILFTKEDVASFRRKSALEQVTAEDLERVSNQILSIYQASSISAMKEIIQACPTKDRYALFVYYNRQLSQFSDHLKKVLS